GEVLPDFRRGPAETRAVDGSARYSATGGLALPYRSSRCCGRVRCLNCEAAFGKSKHGDPLAKSASVTRDWTVCGTSLPAEDESPRMKSTRSPLSWMRPCRPSRRG